jgi:hypothetical protein
LGSVFSQICARVIRFGGQPKLHRESSNTKVMKKKDMEKLLKTGD